MRSLRAAEPFGTLAASPRLGPLSPSLLFDHYTYAPINKRGLRTVDYYAIGNQPLNYKSVSPQLKSIAVRVSLGLVLFASVSCASNQPRVNDIQLVNQSLQGAWLLTSYRPLMSLDVPLAALVNPQLGRMQVIVNSTQMSVQGPGVQVARTYQVLKADEMFATLAITAPTGEVVRVSISIDGNVLTFHPLDAPWTGEGTLRRL